MEKTVEVEISYCDKDIRQAIFYTINHINRMWVLFPCFFIIIAGMFLYYLTNGFSNYSIGLITFFVVLLLFLYLIYYQIPINRYTDFYRTRKGGTYTFCDQEIRIVGKEVQMTGAWSIFKAGCEIPNAFLLTDENRFIYVFPKKCFKNSSDVESLRQLMNEKIKNFKTYI